MTAISIGINSFVMEITRENLLEFMERKRHEKGWSKRRIATESGVPYSNIIDFYRGICYIFKGDRLQKILSVLGENNTVPIPKGGTLYADGRVEAVKDSDEKEFAPLPPGVEYTRKLHYIDVAENNFGVCFKGWRIYYDDYVEGRCTDLTSMVPHYIKIKNGGTFIKFVRRGHTPGRYNLVGLSNPADIIEDTDIDWCWRVKAIVPR